MWQHRLGWDEVESDINGRAAENTVRLTTIRAISRDPDNPTISLNDVEWAWAVVYRTIELIASGVSVSTSYSPPKRFAMPLRSCGTLPTADSDEAAPLFRDDCAPGFRDDLAPLFSGVCRR
ncbi:hypothetical protein GHK28_05210 [Sinorhizobium medicae]|nr:hypothetical protein [Sinorhizobium medicae]MQV45443.1 hypothetical protein [Sinorhizobium medicae]MQV52627.1 hypothetical protein [Sinorhizobium medicae]MQV71418.1 hypothetical protein [Sinorhizobium medicae]